jgi:hypothetical protein
LSLGRGRASHAVFRDSGDLVAGLWDGQPG